MTHGEERKKGVEKEDVFLLLHNFSSSNAKDFHSHFQHRAELKAAKFHTFFLLLL